MMKFSKKRNEKEKNQATNFEHELVENFNDGMLRWLWLLSHSLNPTSECWNILRSYVEKKGKGVSSRRRPCRSSHFVRLTGLRNNRHKQKIISKKFSAIFRTFREDRECELTTDEKREKFLSNFPHSTKLLLPSTRRHRLVAIAVFHTCMNRKWEAA